MIDPQPISPLISLEEAAKILMVSSRWLRDHADEFGGTRDFRKLKFFREIIHGRLEKAKREMELRVQAQGTQDRQVRLSDKAGAQAAEAREKERLKKSATLTTFLEAATKRLDYLSAFCTQAHFRDNRAILKKFMTWHDLFIEDITPEMIGTRLIELVQELGNLNATRHLVALKAVFNLAVKDGQLPRNPCIGIPKFPTEKAVKSIPLKNHIAQVMLLAKPLDRAYLNVIRFTAARVREINNLTWEDVEFEKRTVRLWTRKKKGGHKTPRLVPMVQETFTALKYAWENRDRTSPYVFTNPLTKKNYDYRDKFLDTLCRRAGLPGFGYHALRHHTASILAEHGAPLTDIQKILGHERPTTTDNYLQNLGESSGQRWGFWKKVRLKVRPMIFNPC